MLSRKIIITTILFIVYAFSVYFGLVHPIVFTPSVQKWRMSITIYENGQTTTAIVTHYVHNGITYHVETLWNRHYTTVYTITTRHTSIFTFHTSSKTRVRVTSITVTTVIHRSITSTITHTNKSTITIVMPSKSIQRFTSKIIEANKYSVVIWASEVTGDRTIIGYTTFYYTTTHK